MKRILTLLICFSVLFTCQLRSQNLSNNQKIKIQDEIQSRFMQIIEKIGHLNSGHTNEFISEDGFIVLNGKSFKTDKVKYNLGEFFVQIGGKRGVVSDWWDIISPKSAVQVIYGEMRNEEQEKQYVWTAVWEKVEKEWKIRHLHQSWSQK